MTIIEQIKAEIERRKSLLTQHSKLTYDLILETFIKEYDDFLSFLSTLESEKPVPADLEEAAHSYSESDEPLYSPGHRFHWDSDSLFGKQIETTFKAGAKWQKEQMLKDAVEKTVGQLERQWGGNIHFMHGFEVDEMDFPFLNSQECGYGDKVRVIVIPNTKEK